MSSGEAVGRKLPIVISLVALTLAAAALAISLDSPDERPQRISASMLADDSVTGEKVDESSLRAVPRARVAERATDSRALQGRSARDFVPVARLRSTRGLRKLSTGDEVVLLRKSPFSFRAKCSRGKDGEGARLELIARSRLPRTIVFFGGKSLPEFGRGPGRSFAALDSTGAAFVSDNAITVTTPRGPAAVGIISFGINSFGGDCVASMVAIG